ncbi:Na+/H+ antiporter [Mariniradius saccharolyticus AK6]|uniref:Na+/H+ antiporter n=1 Tax=Mariniradius saccharolyticus AK6 TaxID=1239962 RepID=M7X590_9BACT|nr:Na+/H+ antiporter [Mariniradius saccharolyticus AK6]
MVFVLIGLIVSFLGIEFLEEGPKAGIVKPFAELTLILVLFIDASTINRNVLRLDMSLPLRLLLIGLPLTMLLGALLALPLFPEISTVALVMMAFILSPTDAALGQAVVTGEQVPLRIRQTINVESGLNDGIALPPILICFAILSGKAGGSTDFSYWFTFIVKQFLFGPIIGGFVGWLGGVIVEKYSKKGWMSHTYQMLASVAIAILAYSLAEHLGGNGFIAAYFAGLMLGTQSEMIRERIREFGEAESQVLIMFIFLLFGMILLPISYQYWDWRAWVYAVLSLTIIRILPVALSLIGSGLDRKTVLFIGWFGPRGIASVLYLLMAVIQLGVEGYEKVTAVISLTVFLSIFLHGLTALPFSKLFSEKDESPSPSKQT